jgi:hypothetical protein
VENESQYLVIKNPKSAHLVISLRQPANLRGLSHLALTEIVNNRQSEIGLQRGWKTDEGFRGRAKD